MQKYVSYSEEFQDLVELWTMTQFDLQELWNFERDATRHPTWTLPGCTCPKMDNADMRAHMYFDVECPVHEDKLSEKVFKNKK